MTLLEYANTIQQLAKQANEDKYSFLSSMLWILAGCLSYAVATNDPTLLTDLAGRFLEHSKVTSNLITAYDDYIKQNLQ